MQKRCTKGKSCGATCISRPDRCVLELGPVLSKSLTQAREKIGVMVLWAKVQEHGAAGRGAKFGQIRKDLKQELNLGNRQIKKTEHLEDFQKKLKEAGLLPRSKKNESGNLGDIFAKKIEAGKKESKKPESLPSDLRRQLFALPGPKNSLDQARERFSAAQKGNDPNERWEARKALAAAEKKAGVQQAPVEGRKLERSPGANERTAPEVRRELANIVQAAKKGEMTLMMDDISRIMRGSLPQNLEVASAGNELGMKARLKGSGTQAGSASADTKWARGDAKDFDGSFKIYKRIRGDKDMIDWDETVRNGKQIGEGSFGTVMRVGNVAHKRGEVGAEEANIIKRVGEAGIGPRLLGAEISTKKREGYGVDLHNGRIAMSIVPGKEMGEVASVNKFSGKNAADVYWKAMADLHRLGIAHNDAHPHNLLVDDKGKGRWVDMGLAQQSPKAALAEALGSFSSTLRNTKPQKNMPSAAAGHENRSVGGGYKPGNWQTRGWSATGMNELDRMSREGSRAKFVQQFPVLGRVADNRGNVQYALLNKYGLTRDEVASLGTHGIRSPLETYNKGAWSKLTDKQAQDLLNTLYDGI